MSLKSLNLQIVLGSMDILMMLILPIHEHNICFQQEIERYTRLKVKEWRKIFYSNGKKKSWVTVHISNKVDFKTKAIARDKEGDYIMTKG